MPGVLIVNNTYSSCEVPVCSWTQWYYLYIRVAAWCSGDTLVSINVVALLRARLLFGWVTA